MTQSREHARTESRRITGDARSCLSRRNFLILGGSSVAVLASWATGAGAQDLVSSAYSRQVIGQVSALQPGVPMTFTYPTDDIENILVMLDEEAGGGIGDGRNIVAFLSGVDPYETKTVLFTEWMMYGDNPSKKMIFVTPHRTMGVEYGLANGGLWQPVVPGSDTALHLELAKIIIDNGWQDQAFIDTWVNNKWEIELGYGRGTRNTRWQWRTTWGRWQSDWQDFQKFITEEKAAELGEAAAITGVDADLIEAAAEIIAKPRPDGTRPKTSFMLEKGNYWSNNYMNMASLASLGLICGAGNRPGQVISRGGGHQRGGMGAGGGKGFLSPEKYPGRRKKSLNVDRWVMDGKVRFMWTIGLTWFPAMLASQELASRVADLTVRNANQPRHLDKEHLVEVFEQRVDLGGMMLVDSDIYPVDPLNTQLADIVLPATGWGEVDFTRCNAERRKPCMAKRWPWPHITIHPDDAAAQGIEFGRPRRGLQRHRLRADRHADRRQGGCAQLHQAARDRTHLYDLRTVRLRRDRLR